MNAQTLYCVMRPSEWPRPDQLHPSPLAAWQAHLGSELTGHQIVRQARAEANQRGVRCCAFLVARAGICPDEGL